MTRHTALLPALALSLILAGTSPPAQAQGGTSFFGSADRVPANPFASNYASPPVGAGPAYERRPRRLVRTRRDAPLRPPRDLSR